MPTLRIEFAKYAQASDGVPDASALSRVLREAELTIGATATATADQPAVLPFTTHVVLTAIGGACYVDWDGQKGVGEAADPVTPTRLYLPADQSRVVTGVAIGAKFACIEATAS